MFLIIFIFENQKVNNASREMTNMSLNSSHCELQYKFFQNFCTVFLPFSLIVASKFDKINEKFTQIIKEENLNKFFLIQNWFCFSGVMSLAAVGLLMLCTSVLMFVHNPRQSIVNMVSALFFVISGILLKLDSLIINTVAS